LSDNIVKEILTSSMLGKEGSRRFISLLDGLPSFDQRNTLYSVLKIATREYLSPTITTEDNSQWWKGDTCIVSAVAGLINLLIANDEARKNYLISWITNSSGAGIGDGIAIRRAVVASLVQDKCDMETILDKSIQQFGDQLYIKHTPTLQQEGTILLLIHIYANMLSSSYPSSPSVSRLCSPNGSSSFGNDDAIRGPSECRIQQTSCIIPSCSLPGNGGW
jgi:telomere length regulation protein